MNILEQKVVSAQQYDNEFSFFTEQGAKIIVSFISSETIRISVQFCENEVFDKSYAIDEIHFEKTDAGLEENDEYYTAVSDGITVRVYKNRALIEYLKNGKVITAATCLRREGEVISCRHAMGENEHFYGLGEDNDAYLGNMDRRGTTRDMITGQRINIGHVTADIPVTFFMSTGENSPYGIFVDTSYINRFDMGKADPEEYSWKIKGGSLVYYLFSGDSFADILNGYTDITGKPSMPPLWALGYIQCKCSYWCWDEIDEIIETLREKKVPLDCIVFDFDWAGDFHNFKWNKRWQGLSPEKIKEYRKQGLHFMVSNSGPMIRKDSEVFESALEAGILAKDKDGNTVTCGHYGGELMDFTNPDIKEWLRPKLDNLLDEGVESWWLDLTEPEGDPDGTQYHDGDKVKVHNIFSLMNTKTYNQITLEYEPNRRPFILTRTGTAGIQKYNVSIWSGDVFSDYKTFAAHIPEALNTTMSGIPMWTSDSGGFMSSTSNSLDNRNIYKNDAASHSMLYERWLQFAAFCPVTRVHHAGQSSPFVFGDMLTNDIAHYVRLRYRLLPYIYSYAHRTHLTGEPLMRALVFDYTDDENVLDIKDEFLFGKEMLVAPVTEERATDRKVYFPEGEWYDLNYGYRYEGGKSYTVYAPQNRIPVFIKAGAVIPMAQQVYNTKDLDRDKINLVIYPKGHSEFRLYADDGISYEFEHGSYTETLIRCDEEANRTKINIASTNTLFTPKEYRFEIHVNAKPVEVKFGDRQLNSFGYKNLLKKTDCGWYYDEFNAVLYIKLKADTERLDELVISNGDAVIKPSDNDESEEVTGQLPFILPPASLPCQIRCVNYDRGGEGVAYHRVDDKIYELYRKDHVEIEPSDDTGAGQSIKDLKASEWLEYTVNVREAGSYRLALRVQGEGKVSVEFDENASTEIIPINEKRWNTVDLGTVTLSEGEQVMRIFVHDGCVRLNWVETINCN
ncbi:MAG: DUF5110 domain-containing protein [Ruminococcus albus]|nr:DUF5110 domain-containing protein [Ruminococcus albus]